jgi:periplasmic divalent cation tolerance protein
MSSPFAFLYVPVGSQENAEVIAKHLISEKLAACVNVLPQIKSYYQWQGKLEEGQELLLIIKTSKHLLPQVKEEIAKLHSYQVPCIAEIDIKSLNPEYEAWVKSVLR